MKFRVDAKKLCKVLEAHVGKSKLKQDCSIEALQGSIVVRASDGAVYSEVSIPAEVEQEGKAVVYTPMLLMLLKNASDQNVYVELQDGMNRLSVQLEDGAKYLLPLGLCRDDDNPLGRRLAELMSQATPVASFQPKAWQETASAVKKFTGDWEFNNILLLPISQPNWTLTKRVAAVAATDQYILGAVLLDPEQVELYIDSIVFIPPELSSLPVESFALASFEDKNYIYAILQNGFVGAPTQANASGSFGKTIDCLLTAPADVELRFDRTTWRTIKKAFETYQERKTSRSVRSTAGARWDIYPNGSHKLWSATENEILFTADKAEVTGTIPRTCTFHVNLLARATAFIPIPSAIELSFNEQSCTMRLRDEFNYRICVLQSMVVGSDYESSNPTEVMSDEAV